MKSTDENKKSVNVVFTSATEVFKHRGVIARYSLPGRGITKTYIQWVQTDERVSLYPQDASPFVVLHG